MRHIPLKKVSCIVSFRNPNVLYYSMVYFSLCGGLMFKVLLLFGLTITSENMYAETIVDTTCKSYVIFDGEKRCLQLTVIGENPQDKDPETPISLEEAIERDGVEETEAIEIKVEE